MQTKLFIKNILYYAKKDTIDKMPKVDSIKQTITNPNIQSTVCTWIFCTLGSSMATRKTYEQHYICLRHEDSFLIFILLVLKQCGLETTHTAYAVYSRDSGRRASVPHKCDATLHKKHEHAERVVELVPPRYLAMIIFEFYEK